MGQVKQQALQAAEELRKLADMLESQYGCIPDGQQSEQSQQGEPEPEPVEASVDFDTVKQAVVAAAKVDRNAAVEVLQAYGASKATELAEEHYAEAFNRLQKVAKS